MYYLLLFNIKHYLFNNACLYYIPIYHFHTYILKMLLRVNFRIFNAVLFAEQFFKNYSLICCPSQSKSVSYLILRSMRCDNYELNKRFIWLFDSTCHLRTHEENILLQGLKDCLLQVLFYNRKRVFRWMNSCNWCNDLISENAPFKNVKYPWKN